MTNLGPGQTVTARVEQDDEGVTSVLVLVGGLLVAVATISGHSGILASEDLGVPSYEVIVQGTQVVLPHDPTRSAVAIGRVLRSPTPVNVSPDELGVRR